MNFLDIYCIQGLGNTISDLLDIADDQALDSTCKDVRQFNREYVYPLYTSLYTREIATMSPSSFRTQLYMKKLGPFIKDLKIFESAHFVRIPLIEFMPNLEEVVYAVPLHIDVTNGRIHPVTEMHWQDIQNFLASLFREKNKVKSVTIVPGAIQLHRCVPATWDVLESQTFDDETEASHARLYRKLAMPPLVSLAPHMELYMSTTFQLEKLHMPRELMSLTARIYTNHLESLDVTTWDTAHDGPVSFLLDLDLLN
jgi:hypothetical protein